MARRRKRSTRRRSVSRRRRNPQAVRRVVRRASRRRDRRNPGGGGFGLRGIMGTVTRGAKCGAFVIAGEGLSGSLPGLVRLPTTGPVGYAARIAAGVILATVSRRFIGSENAAYLVAGAFAGVYRRLLSGVNIPFLSAGLAGYAPIPGGPVAGLNGYPQRKPGLGATAPVGATYLF